MPHTHRRFTRLSRGKQCDTAKITDLEKKLGEKTQELQDAKKEIKGLKRARYADAKKITFLEKELGDKTEELQDADTTLEELQHVISRRKRARSDDSDIDKALSDAFKPICTI